MRYLVPLLLAAAAVSSASAQSLPDSENGRYTMSPVKDGVVRLDTRSGAVSTCTDKGNGWACTTMPDERAAFDTEIGRLQNENEALKAQLSARGDSGSNKSADTRKIEIPLPSDRDIDRVMSTMERAWRRLVEMAGRWQQDSSGKI